MDRCALFVDAGYALADGAMAVHGTRRLDSVSWDHAGLLKLLAGLARDRTGLPVLRCYWYETAEGNRTAEHDALAEMPGLKLRIVNTRPGRREGVESQLRRDLLTLAKNGAISDAFIASADEDLAQLVSEVQDLGLRVVVLHIATDNGWTIPQPLRRECDDIVEISGVHLRPFVELIHGAEPSLPQEPSYSAANVVTDSNKSLGGTPVDSARGRNGLPARELPVPVGARAPETDASYDPQPHDAAAGHAAAAAAYQAAPVARDAGVVERSGGGQHRHAAPAISVEPDVPYGLASGSPASDGATGGRSADGDWPDGSLRPGSRADGGWSDSSRTGSGWAEDGWAFANPANGSVLNAGTRNGGARDGSALSGGVLNAGALDGGSPNGRATDGAPWNLPAAESAYANGDLSGAGTVNDRGTNGRQQNGNGAIGRGPSQHGMNGAAANGSSAKGDDIYSGAAPSVRAHGSAVHNTAHSSAANSGAENIAAANGRGENDAAVSRHAVHHGAVNGFNQYGLSNGGPAVPEQPPASGQMGPRQGVRAPMPADRPPIPAQPEMRPQLPVPSQPGMQARPSMRVQPAPSHPPVGRQSPLPAPPPPNYPADPPYPGVHPAPGPEMAISGVQGRGAAPGYPPDYRPPQQYQHDPRQASALPAVRPAHPVAVSLPDAVEAAYSEGFRFGKSVSRDAPGLWLEAVLARKPRMPSDLEARLLQMSVLPIDSLLHDEVRHSLRRGFWDALESSRR